MTTGAGNPSQSSLTLDDIRGKATISVPEAGELLGLGRASSYTAALKGEIPSIKIGRRTLVPVAKLLTMLGEPASLS